MGDFITLGQVLEAGAATGLASRLRRLEHSRGQCRVPLPWLQALQRCSGLTHLQLRHLGATPLHGPVAATLVSTLRSLTLLTHLDLRGCDLGPERAGKLAPALEQLAQLEHLCLAQVQLGTCGFDALAPAIAAMASLQSLDVSGSSVGSSPALAAALSDKPCLTCLDLSPGQLPSLPIDAGGGGHTWSMLLAPLQAMSQLRHLRLHNASLSRRDAREFLQPALSALSTLQTLDVACPRLLAHDVSQLCPALFTMPRLISLHLNHQDLSVCATLDRRDIPVVSVLGSPQLHLLLLGAQSPTPATLPAAASVAGQRNSQQDSYPSRTCSLQPKAAATFSATALGEGCGLAPAAPAAAWQCRAASGFGERLQIRQEGPAASDFLTAAWARLAPESGLSSLRALKLSFGCRGSLSIAVLVPVLARPTALIELFVSGCRMAGCAHRLALALDSMHQLQLLSLQSCALGPEGASELAPALQALGGCLQQLSLKGNALGARGMAALAAALAAMRSLRVLDLADNDLDAQAANILGPLLRRMQQLREFDAWKNRLGAAGCLAIGKALAGRDKRVAVQLGLNDIWHTDDELEVRRQLEALNGVDVEV